MTNTSVFNNLSSLPQSEGKNNSGQFTKIYSENNKLSIEPNIELIRLMKK